MPHFDKDGNSTWLCQFCHSVFSDLVASTRLPIPGIASRPDGSVVDGNACPRCAERQGAKRKTTTVAQLQSDTRIKWITARFSTACPNHCGVTIQTGDKIGKPKGVTCSHFVCERCAVVLQSTAGLDKPVIAATPADMRRLSSERVSRVNRSLRERDLEPLNVLDYADNLPEFELQQQLRRMGISNEPRPEQCREHLCELEEVGGMVGETMLRCLQGGEIVWEDAEGAIRRVY